MNLEILARPLSGSALVRDYLAAAPALAPFFFGHPSDPAACRRKAEEVSSRFTQPDWGGSTEAVIPTSEGAREKLAQVLRGAGFVVTTGQQAGLFGGPLYTIYKVLTAVRLAHALETLLDRPVAPVFWVASDDHDWEEIRRTWVIDPSNQLHEVALPPASPEGSAPSAGRRTLGGDVERALNQLTDLLPTTDFTPDLLELLGDCYRPGETAATAFRELLRQLFSRFDLLLIDPQHPVLRRLAAPVLRRELERRDAHEELLASNSRRLQEHGYHSQVPILPGAANVFLEDETGRERLLGADGAWQLRRSGRTLTEGELDAMLESHPERFSANVLLRPVVESSLLPTLAYVAGPGELAYFAQLGCLFREHGLEMPLVHPRASILLVESKIRKVLEKFELQPEDFRRPADELAARLVREELPEDVVSAISGIRADLHAGYRKLLDAARELDPTLKGPLTAARNSSDVALRETEKRIRQHLKKLVDIDAEQLHKARVNLYPEGEPQERRISPFQFLARYGGELLSEVADRIEIRIEGREEAWTGVDC